MSQSIGEVLYQLLNDQEFSEVEIVETFREIIQNPKTTGRDIQLSGLFYLLMKRTPSASLVSEFLRSAFELDRFVPRAKKIKGVENITCVAGSGKKQFKTMNISTFSAITAATAGAKIIKPGSTAVSSVLGSADLMSMLSIPVFEEDAKIEEMLKKTNIAFFKIENIIPKFDAVYGGKFLTVNPLSFALPALLSPIHYDNLLYGLSHPNLELSADVLQSFDIQNLRVVSAAEHEHYHIDEMGLFEYNYFVRRTPEQPDRRMEQWNVMEELGISPYAIDRIRSRNNSQENVDIMLNALQGRGDSIFVDILSINAASMLELSGLVENLREGYYICRYLLRIGKVYEKFQQILEFGENQSSRSILVAR